MSKNYYPEMLDIIKDDFPVDRSAVYEWMLRHRPHSVIQAIKATSETLSPIFYDEPAYVEECRKLIRDDKVISAIKYWREKTGAGLKESKDAIDNLRAEKRP